MDESKPLDGSATRAGVLAAVSAICADASRDSGTHGVSVSLASPATTLSPVWASDATAEALEERQITLGEGPCVDAVVTGRPVLVDDLRALTTAEVSWPTFLREVADVQARGLFAFPLRTGLVSLGTMEFYRRDAGDLSGSELTAALDAADVVGGVLLALGAEAESEEIVPRYRLVVNQAAGMITVQLEVPIEEAMSRLRARAYADGRSINEVAADVVDRRLRFIEEET